MSNNVKVLPKLFFGHCGCPPQEKPTGWDILHKLSSQLSKKCRAIEILSHSYELCHALTPTLLL